MKAGLASVALAVALPAQADEILFRCNFDWVCDPNRTCQDAALDIRYRLDTDTNRAARLGAPRPGVVNAVIGDRAVTLVETPISGGLAMTTLMLASGDAVHSDHAVDGTTLTPMQYLGNCVAM